MVFEHCKNASVAVIYANPWIFNILPCKYLALRKSRQLIVQGFCRRVDPRVSEAHCGYTSFHEYVITIHLVGKVLSKKSYPQISDVKNIILKSYPNFFIQLNATL